MKRKDLPPMELVRNDKVIPLVRNYRLIPQFRRLHPVKITRNVEFAPHNYKIARPIREKPEGE